MTNIAVFGATGQQGGSVLRALIQDGNFHVKAITRDPDSDKAKELATLKNVSVHKADLNDPNTVDQVLNGCQATFLVTDIAFHADSKETEQGINLIKSAIKNKLNHVVFSGLEHVKKVIGKDCKHFDNKAAIEDFGLSHANEINFTSIRLPGYYQNFFQGSIFKVDSNKFLLTMPIGNAPCYLMDVNDIGECVKTIIKNPNEYKNKIIGVAGDKLNIDEIAQVLNKNLEPLQFSNGNFTIETFQAFRFPGVDDLAGMFEFIKSGNFKRDIELTKKINKNVKSFDDWVKENKDKFIQTYADK